MARTHVSFKGEFPSVPQSGEPAGLELAKWLASSLRKRGIDVDRPENEDDYAYEFTCALPDGRYRVLTGLVQDGPREWLVFFDVPKSFIGRLLGRPTGASASSLAGALHEILSHDPRVTEIRWYEPRGWNEAPDDEWAPTPVGSSPGDEAND